MMGFGSPEASDIGLDFTEIYIHLAVRYSAMSSKEEAHRHSFLIINSRDIFSVARSGFSNISRICLIKVALIFNNKNIMEETTVQKAFREYLQFQNLEKTLKVFEEEAKISNKKYKEDDVQDFDFTDGGIYTIPRGVAEHLNKNGAYQIHAFAKDSSGMPVAGIGKKIHRFGFTSLEFTEDLDLLGNAPSLVTVHSL